MSDTNERIDHQAQSIDFRFGLWIKRARIEAGYGSYYAAALACGIPPLRLSQLEEGTAKKSVTTFECRKLAKLYGLRESEFLMRAIGHA